MARTSWKDKVDFIPKWKMLLWKGGGRMVSSTEKEGSYKKIKMYMLASFSTVTEKEKAF